MGVLKNIFSKIDLTFNKQGQEEDDISMDDVTKDKYLRSLRRQRRIQLEEIEKQQLQKDIKRYEMERTRKMQGIPNYKVSDQELNGTYNMADNLPSKKNLNLLRQKNLIKQKNFFIKKGKRKY